MRLSCTMRTTVMAAAMVVAAAAGGGASREGSPWTLTDLQLVGEFLSELTRSLYANTASICILEERGINRSISDYWRLAAVLSRNFIFVVPCDSPPPSPYPCLAASGTHDTPVCRKNNRIDVYIAEAEQMEEAVELVVARYRASRGDVRQVVVGRQVETPREVAVGVMSWIHASLDQEALVIDLQEMYSFRDSAAALVRQPLGRWQPGVPLMLFHQPGNGPKDFQGQTIFLAAFPYPPYFMDTEMCPESDQFDMITLQLQTNCLPRKARHLLNTELYTGYLMDIFNTLSEKLNFTYRVVLPDNEDNYVFGTGRSDNYSGLVGMVALQQAEIILSTLSVTQDRLLDIDFSTKIDFFVRNLYIRANATESSLGWGTYVLGFELSTWLGTFGLYLVSGCVMWVVSRRKQDRMPLEIYNFRDIMFMFFSCMVQQGVPTTPDSLRGRTVFLLYWVACVVIYAYYTARLTSYLAVSTVEPPFLTLQGAVDSFPEWQIGFMRGTPTKGLFESSAGEEYHKVSSRLDENPGLFVDSEQEGLARLLSENYAFVGDTSTMQYILKGRCSVRELAVNLFPSYGHLGYMKNLPFAGILDKELATLEDGGVLDRMRRQWWGRAIPCEGPSPFTELDFTHTITAFVILFSGIGCSLIFILLEKIYYKKAPCKPVVNEYILRKIAAEEERRRRRKRRAKKYNEDSLGYTNFVIKERDYNISS